MSRDYWKLICKYVESNPYWLWDLVTDPYAVHEFVAEMQRELKPNTDDEADTIERFARRYVDNYTAYWESMSRDSKVLMASRLEQLGLDIDYDLIGA